jgi:hypothetical protein
MVARHELDARARSTRRYQMLYRALQGVSPVLAIAAVLAAPAGAIIGGQADGNAHPYVGAVDVRAAGAPVVASGTLISSTVLLTAGHVTRFFDRAGLTRARVTFDPVVGDSSTWYWGTVHTDPAYQGGLPRDDPNDLGVIVFDGPIPGITPASLPTENLLDRLGARALQGESFTTFGYGVSRFTGGPNGRGQPYPDFTSAGTRAVEQTSFMSFTPAWLRLHQLDGNACYGDSGGPTLLGASNVVVGETITDANLELCDGDAWTMRLDTPAHRAFLAQYVTLP